MLAGGGSVLLPTDTVYGLAVRADRPGAVDQLAALKDRAAEQPVAVLVASVQQAEAVGVLPDWARPVIERWWPGPLTLVLARRPGLAWDLGDPPDTVGVRLPDHDLVRGLAEVVGPLATTSANRHGEPTPPTAAEAVAALTGAPDLVVDGGPCVGPASTVVDATGPEPVVLRPGPIAMSDLGRRLNPSGRLLSGRSEGRGYRMFSRKKAEQEAAVARLGDVAFFEGFTPEELARVADLADEVEAEAGAELMDQGRPGLECFVILDGTAGVYFGGEHIATLEAGLDGGGDGADRPPPRSATVVAETPMRLLAFDTRHFRALLEELPKASQRVMSLLNARAQENAAAELTAVDRVRCRVETADGRPLGGAVGGVADVLGLLEQGGQDGSLVGGGPGSVRRPG